MQWEERKEHSCSLMAKLYVCDSHQIKDLKKP